MMKDAIKFVKKCEKCQKHAPLIHQHSEPYHSVVSPWPFARWGLDIIGKLPLAKPGKCFVLLATDYFTNWVEAESYSSVTTNDVISFIWKFIICRFGLPNSLTMDNGTQFNNLKVEGFCEMYGIRVNYSPVYHPQANGMAEATNKAVVGNMRRNLEDKKGAWLEELPKVLWAQRTTKKRVTDESPFALVFGTEAILPTEAGLPTLTTLFAENVEENQR